MKLLKHSNLQLVQLLGQSSALTDSCVESLAEILSVAFTAVFAKYDRLLLHGELSKPE